jgi:glycosyltransferase A (GT-A) superfamily protein (DUF2064 family)
MVKEPRPGQVKTRLARDIGVIDATWWFRRQVRALLRRLQDPRWELVLAVAPDYRGQVSRQFPPHLMRLPQGRGDLGVRMSRVLRNGPVCVVGSDIPGVKPTHIARAFNALRRHDVVFGPAPDGGFWLVGQSARRPVAPGLFAGARWSGPHALADSVASLSGQSVGFVDVLDDVDSAADLQLK